MKQDTQNGMKRVNANVDQMQPLVIINRWNEDKYLCECTELTDKGICDKGFIWSPSNSQCESDKSRDIGEYLDYENCKCRKRLVDKLVKEGTENTSQTG